MAKELGTGPVAEEQSSSIMDPDLIQHAVVVQLTHGRHVLPFVPTVPPSIPSSTPRQPHASLTAWATEAASTVACKTAGGRGMKCRLVHTYDYLLDKVQRQQARPHTATPPSGDSAIDEAHGDATLRRGCA